MMKRILIPLLLCVLVLSLLILAACKGESPAETEPKETKPEEHYEFLTGVELETGETPVLLFPDNDTTQTFTATGDGTTTVVDLSNEGNPPSEITEVKVNGEVVPKENYQYENGKLEFNTAPEKDAEIEVEATVPTEPPAPTEPTTSSEPVTSSTPGWTGPPETPIIPYHPKTSDGDG